MDLILFIIYSLANGLLFGGNYICKIEHIYNSVLCCGVSMKFILVPVRIVYLVWSIQMKGSSVSAACWEALLGHDPYLQIPSGIFLLFAVLSL